MVMQYFTQQWPRWRVRMVAMCMISALALFFLASSVLVHAQGTAYTEDEIRLVDEGEGDVRDAPQDDPLATDATTVDQEWLHQFLLEYQTGSSIHDQPSQNALDSSGVSFSQEPPLVELPPTAYVKAEIMEILEETRNETLEGYIEVTQLVRARIRDGEHKGDMVEAKNQGVLPMDAYRDVAVGDSVVLEAVPMVDHQVQYYVRDQYRLPQIGGVLALLAGLAVLFGRWKGVGSLFGLGISVLVLLYYIVPSIMDGKHPLIVTLIGACVIAATSLFLAHGFNRRTAISLLSTSVTLVIAFIASYVVVRFTSLSGMGSEEAVYLQVTDLSSINLRGLLLAGIVIGTLGVLDDITTTQTATVGELRRANPNLSMRELYTRALVVGKEHIASLINTLVLAYAGAALPLFLLLQMNDAAPWWLQLNSELFAEEIIRTAIGSAALILAVPISTLCAACFLSKKDGRYSAPR